MVERAGATADAADLRLTGRHLGLIIVVRVQTIHGVIAAIADAFYEAAIDQASHR